MRSLLFVLAVLAQDPTSEDVDQAVTKLYSDRYAESEFAKQELIDIGRRAIPKLVAELKGQRPMKKETQIRVRRLLCEVLGRIRDNSQAVLDALTDRLTDADVYGISVAAAAAGALGAIADDRAAGALITALTHKNTQDDRWLKYYCIHGLGVMRSRQAAEALKKALEDKEAAKIAGEDSQIIAAAACDALGRIRADGATEGLCKLLNEMKVNPFTQQPVAVHAARALERIMKESRGSLEGDQATVTESLASWRNWWNREENKRKVAETRAIVAAVAAAVERYRKDAGEYPKAKVYLKSKPEAFKGTWPEGGYYAGELKDAWNRELNYSDAGTNGAPFDVISLGSDGTPWGKDEAADLWNHEGWKKALPDRTRENMKKIQEAIEKFKAAQDAWPKALRDLETKPASIQKDYPAAGYLKVPRDGFDQEFKFASQVRTGGVDYDLYSLGADLAEGGVDENADLWNHDRWKASRAETTKSRIGEIAKALEAFKKDNERYPAQLRELVERPGYAKKWSQGGYTRESLNDGFGNAFIYAVPGTGGRAFDLMSHGGDGRPGGTGADEDVSHPVKK